nr:mevalonate kinase [Tissierella sp.]
MDKERTFGSAIGKIILMGEHSVVYGQPAIAIPFPNAEIRSEVSQGMGDTMLICSSYSGKLKDAPENFEGLRTMVKMIMEEFDHVLEAFNNVLKDFNINIESTIPSERGMGSSAAVAASTVRALYDYFEKPLDREILTRWVNCAEKIVHGNPSGIDTAIVVGEEPLYYIKGEPLEEIDCQLDAFLIVADTGEKGETKFAVAKVKEFVDETPHIGIKTIERLGKLVSESREKIENNDVEALGRNMNEAQELLETLGVSNKAIESLVEVARESGALGSKLTGGGLGGCIISLCKDKADAEKISKALIDTGAANTWIINMAGV